MHCGAWGDPEEADEGPSPHSPHPAGQSLHPFLGKQTGARGWGDPVRVELVGVRGRHGPCKLGGLVGGQPGPCRESAGCGMDVHTCHLHGKRVRILKVATGI